MEEHPLLRPVVLQQVFGYLKSTAKFETVKTIRQVCRVWRDESLDWWRKEAVLQVELEEKVGVSHEHQLLELMQAPDLFYRLEDKPFQNFKLKNFTINIPKAFEEGTEANALWKLVGPHVNHLNLSKVDFVLGDNTLDQWPLSKLHHAPMLFLMEHVPMFESLVAERLTLNGGATRIPSNVDFLKLKLPSLVSLKCIKFSHFCFPNVPNLQVLGMDDCNVLVAMLKNISKSEDGQVVIPGLKELGLDLDKYSTCLHASGVTIRNLRLPDLRRLKLSLRKYYRDNCYKALRVLMKNHLKQLEVLELFMAPFVRPVSFVPHDCELDNLTELRIYGNMVQDLDFLAWKPTPRLKVLHFDKRCMEKMEELQRDPQNWRMKKHTQRTGCNVYGGYHDTLINLTDLETLEYLHFARVSLIDLAVVSDRMNLPQLKTLRTDLSPGLISAICRQWPDLEHLVGLHGSELRDEDIVGDQEEELEGLSSLKHLKTFHYKPLCDKSRLTDAVVPVFWNMDHLTDLQICVSKKFTPEAEESLKDWMEAKGVVRIIRNYTGNEEHSGWQCCKEKQFSQFLDQGDHDMNTVNDDSSGSEFSGEESDLIVLSESEEEGTANSDSLEMVKGDEGEEAGRKQRVRK